MSGGVSHALNVDVFVLSQPTVRSLPGNPHAFCQLTSGDFLPFQIQAVLRCVRPWFTTTFLCRRDAAGGEHTEKVQHYLIQT